MTPREAVVVLKRVADRLGIEVEIAAFDRHVLAGKGGLCTVRGRRKIVMDAGLSPVDHAIILARCLARFDLDQVTMTPALRMYVLSFKRGARRRVPPWGLAPGPTVARARYRPAPVR